MLEAFPKTDVRVAIVWIDMLPGDDADAARKSAGIFEDDRVTHFHDPRATRLAGNAFGRRLLAPGAGPAWDVYLFFNGDAEWTDEPPDPADWMHQLSGAKRADPQRFHAADDLVRTLRRVGGRLFGDPKPESDPK